MGKRYRIHVSGKARQNPDPVLLAHIVILIGRRLHAEHLQQHARKRIGATEGVQESPEDLATINASAPDAQAGPFDGG